MALLEAGISSPLVLYFDIELNSNSNARSNYSTSKELAEWQKTSPDDQHPITIRFDDKDGYVFIVDED